MEEREVEEALRRFLETPVAESEPLIALEAVGGFVYALVMLRRRVTELRRVWGVLVLCVAVAAFGLYLAVSSHIF